jgi:hypothetical protein
LSLQNHPNIEIGENIMKKFIVILAAVAICFGISINVDAQNAKARPSPNPTPVSSDTAITSTIHDSDSNGILYNLRSDSDLYNPGVLFPYYHGDNSIESIFQGGEGDWVLDTRNSTRTVFFDFGNATWNSKPLTGYYPVRFITQCSPNFLATLTSVGATTTCPLIINLDHTPDNNWTNLSLRFYANNYPGTDNVKWTCTALGSDNKCSIWQAQISNDYKLKAQLLEINRKGRGSTTPIGLHSFSFDILLAKQ